MKSTLIIMAIINMLCGVMFLAKNAPTEQTVQVPVDPKFAVMIWRVAAGLLLMNALCFMAVLPNM